MSTPKIYTSQQFSQSQQQITHCPRCHQQQQLYIELGCGHKFCIVCITFSYLKYKNLLSNKLKCLQCQKLSQLDQQLNGLIQDIIQKELGPIVKGESQNNNGNNDSRMSINQLWGRQARKNTGGDNHQHSVNLQPSQHRHINYPLNSNSYQLTNHNNKQKKNTFKSQQQSFIAHSGLTPTKNPNRFYSKCQSPQLSSQDEETVINDTCPLHAEEQVSYICMSCGIKPLCYKCIKSNRHFSHDVKIVKKAVEVMNQRLGLVSLETAERVENIELYQKRLYDRKVIFGERVEKSIKEIKAVFASLQRKISDKAAQIVQQYQNVCVGKISQIEQKTQQSSQILQRVKHFQHTVQDFLSATESIPTSKSTTLQPTKIVQHYQQIQTLKRQLFPQQEQANKPSTAMFHLQQQIIDPGYHNLELIRWVGKITEEVDNMTLGDFTHLQKGDRSRFNQTVPITSILKGERIFNKNRTVALRECSSREKLHKYTENYPAESYGKRIKTNVPASLNTSRDKRDKKPTTKTEEDQRRLKSKATHKTQANTIPKNSVNNTEKQLSKEIPSYITKCIEKHQTQNSRKVSPFSHTIGNMIESSKNNSKIIGRSGVQNEEINNRKKRKQGGQFQAIKEKKQMVKSAKNVEVKKRKL